MKREIDLAEFREVVWPFRWAWLLAAAGGEDDEVLWRAVGPLGSAPITVGHLQRLVRYAVLLADPDCDAKAKRGETSEVFLEELGRAMAEGKTT